MQVTEAELASIILSLTMLASMMQIKRSFDLQVLQMAYDLNISSRLHEQRLTAAAYPSACIFGKFVFNVTYVCVIHVAFLHRPI